jgi:predicted RNA methylase/HEAT repeat protein
VSRRRPAGFALERAIDDPGFTPRAGDVPALLDLYARGGDTADAAERALLRAGEEAGRQAEVRAREDAAEERWRWVRLLGRLAAARPEGELVERLAAHLGDEDARARRLAASALGRVRTQPAEVALAAALTAESVPEVRAAIVEALGKVGGERALEALEATAPEGERGGETLGRARLRITRTLGRSEPSRFLAGRGATRPTPVVLRCRGGLKRLLAGELDPRFAPRVPEGEEGRVEATLTGAPDELLRARTMLSLGFPLPARRLPDASPEALARALADALASDEAAALLRHFTEGPIRYRIAWAGGGKRRAVVWRTAQEVAERRPELVNDPSGSTWEAEVRVDRTGTMRVELAPRFEDARFAYRRGDVPAASHPTLAAALVRVAGVRADDVVWDPFVGSGGELCERALAGPYRRLIGTDLDPNALAVARENLAAAGAEHVELAAADALVWAPAEPVTLVVTNPPMGRRVLRGADLGAVLERFVANAARALAPGGRLVWISPLPKRTADAAERAGLEPTWAQEVDMGGFRAGMQAFRKPAAARQDASPAARQLTRAGDTSARRTSRRPPPRG